MNEDKWREYRDEHVQHLKERGITSAYDYVEQFSSEDLDTDRMEETRKALNEMTNSGLEGLRGFCRVYPRNDQDVMFINSNPKLNVGENFVEKDNYLLSVTDQFKYREAISVAGGIEWLTDDYYFWNWIKILGSLPGVSPPWERRNSSTSVRDWIKSDRLQNVYYTNWYKFASQKEEYYTDSRDDGPVDWEYNTDLASEMLDAEIRTVDPDVIVAFGRQVWREMFKGNVESQYLGEGYSATGDEGSLYKVHGFPFRSEEYQARVLPLYHPAGWTHRVYKDFPRESRSVSEEDQERREMAVKIDGK
ncbi:uracil-DNA glycosylase family protein [Natronorubrum sp. A-ect3]|uniref:uracil-DNA glycosylase family protein n=1 Tax=Natronorubrum sp. A-ect3 TaxID=3242698 RepID=UPI00359D90F1